MFLDDVRTSLRSIDEPCLVLSYTRIGCVHGGDPTLIGVPVSEYQLGDDVDIIPRDRGDVTEEEVAFVVAGGSSVAIVAGLPFGILIGQTWGWRSAMWVLVVLAVLSTLAITLLPPVHAPRMTLRQRGAALGDRRVLGILAGTVTVLTPAFLVLAYLPAIM